MRTITRATSRPGLASALIVATALASCGGSGDEPATTAATSVATTKEAPPAPDGHLSTGEYRAIQEVIKRSGRIERLSAGARPRATRAACRGLASAPRTELILGVRSDCAQAVRVFEVVARLGPRYQKECEQAAQAGDVSCYSQFFRTVANTARVAGARGAALSALVRGRHLSRVCASAVGQSPRSQEIYRQLSRNARGVALAFEAKDQARLNRALAAVRRDYRPSRFENAARTLRRLRACRA